jgi:SpoVK/Ycf46/Vps4 family AAA+-type ATPase
LFVKAAKMAREMDSKCAVLFFDEIDALGQSRGGGGGTPSTGDPTHTNQMSCASGGGADGSSRRVLAELLIQMTRLNTSNGMVVDEISAGDKADTSGPYMEEDGTNVEDLSEGDVHLADDQKHLDVDDDISSETMDNTSEYAATNEIDNNEEQQESAKGNIPVRVIVVAATNRPEDCDPA